MAKSNALSAITTEAKRIRKKSPRMSWRSAVKQAGVKYRAGKIRKKSARPTAVKKSAPKKRAARRVAGVPARLQAPHTAAGHMGAAKKLLLNSLGTLEARKFNATTKTAKRQIQKSINNTKVQIRKLK